MEEMGKKLRDNGELKPFYISIKDKVLVFNKIKDQDDLEDMHINQYKNGIYSVHNFKGNKFIKSYSNTDKKIIDQFISNIYKFYKSAFDSLYKNIVNKNNRKHKRCKF